MSIFEFWPHEIYQYIEESFGKPVCIDKLDGIKHAGGCHRIKFRNASVIIKEMKKPQEYLFYNQCAEPLRADNLGVPELFWSYKDGETYWIIIEDIPNPLPRERWNGDQGVLEMLYRLHEHTTGKPLPFQTDYKPQWEDSLTNSVLSLMGDDGTSSLQLMLQEAQEKSREIFKPLCWINADTNPTNWGIRQDGTVVLFDWERFSCGSPAIDLAITIPGLGTDDNSAEMLILNRYLAMRSRLPHCFSYSEQDLLMQIKLAKLWSLVEFLDNASTVIDPKVIKGMLKELPQKLAQTLELINSDKGVISVR